MCNQDVTTYPHWEKTPQTESDWLAVLLNLARYLRGPDGCPWDRSQSARDFAGYCHEESEELLHAFAAGDHPRVEEEWGDVLFVLLASAAAAEQEGVFHVEEALKHAHEKMIRRHEHVFGTEKAESPEDAIRSWQKVKSKEKEGHGE